MEITLKPSKLIEKLLIIGHGLAVIMLFFLPLSDWLMALMTLLLLASFIYSYFFKWLKLPLIQLKYYQNNWRALSQEGELLELDLLKHSRVSAFWCCMYFSVSQTKQKIAIILTRFDLERSQYKRLVRLLRT